MRHPAASPRLPAFAADPIVRLGSGLRYGAIWLERTHAPPSQAARCRFYMPVIPDFSAAKSLLALSIEFTFAAKSGRCNLRTQGWCHSEFHLGVVPQITYNQTGPPVPVAAATHDVCRRSASLKGMTR